MKRLKRVGRCGPHRIEEKRRVLLFLWVRKQLFLKFFDQFGVRVWEGRGGGGDSRRILRLLFLVVARLLLRRLRDGPCKPGPRGIIWLILAQNVQRRFQGIKRCQLKSFATVSIRKNRRIRDGRLANLLDKTVYMSGDWYILLLIMKYACRGRAMERRT